MNIETLNLDDFDISTHETPNFKNDFTSIEGDNVDGMDEYIESESEPETDEEFEIDLDQNENGEFDIEECDNVIFSYPFYSKDNIDYEYRVTINDEELILEQVKCDDNQINFEDCVEVFSEIYRDDLATTFELINKNIDLRDKKTQLQEGIIDYNFNCEDTEVLKKKIENNKISVLFELYKEIIDSFSDY